MLIILHNKVSFSINFIEYKCKSVNKNYSTENKNKILIRLEGTESKQDFTSLVFIYTAMYNI